MLSSDLNQFDHILATFTPIDQETLSPGVADEIGWRGIWQAVWVIEEGEYAGQWAMAPRGAPADLPSFAWAPFGELSDIREPT